MKLKETKEIRRILNELTKGLDEVDKARDKIEVAYDDDLLVIRPLKGNERAKE